MSFNDRHNCGILWQKYSGLERAWREVESRSMSGRSCTAPCKNHINHRIIFVHPFEMKERKKSIWADLVHFHLKKCEISMSNLL